MVEGRRREVLSMTTHAEPSGAELHRAYQRAFEERDRQALLNLIAEDAQWHVFGDSAFAGTIRGRDAIWEKFAAPQWDTPRQMEVHEVLESEDHIVVLGEVSFSQPGGASRFKTVEVYHYDGGQLTERWFFVDRRGDLDELLDRIASADGPNT
jgi:ketosteroid isomerase-like protein